MRKKSHIALAEYLVSDLHCGSLTRHRKAFCLGSVLPDLNPKMVTEPHEFDTSWAKVREMIYQIGADAWDGRGNERLLWRRTGIVMHYLADYFTFPHNSCFPGGLKEHCMYESELKYVFRAFLHTGEARRISAAQRKAAPDLRGAAELIAYIERMHENYMNAEHSACSDCLWIVEVCSRSAAALALIACAGGEEAAWMQNQVA